MRYVKRPTESLLGRGTALYELDGDTVVRQVEVYADRWFSSRKPYHEAIGIGLTDLPFLSSPEWPETEIPRAEFERAWSRAGAAAVRAAASAAGVTQVEMVRRLID